MGPAITALGGPESCRVARAAPVVFERRWWFSATGAVARGF